MTTFIRFSRAVIGLASGYAIAMAPGSAVAEQPDAAWAPSSEMDELLQWHSGLSVESNVCRTATAKCLHLQQATGDGGTAGFARCRRDVGRDAAGHTGFHRIPQPQRIALNAVRVA